MEPSKGRERLDVFQAIDHVTANIILTSFGLFPHCPLNGFLLLLVSQAL
jgi:hypothetical protein